MRAKPWCALLPVILLISPLRLEGQVMSSALSQYLAERTPAIVYIRTTRTLPNGLEAAFAGSGFVISSDGFVITAAHVIDGIDRARLGVSHEQEMNPDWRFSFEASLGSMDGDPRPLHLVRRDDQRDLALLKFDEARDYPHLPIAWSDGIRPTDSILAFGFPVGSITVIPAFGRVTSQSRPDGRWSFDAPVNPGHSGGPVVRRDGRVIGVVHAGIQGLTLMNLMLPLGKDDPLIADARVAQEDVGFNDRSGQPLFGGGEGATPREGSCPDRASTCDLPDHALHWVCAEVVVPRGVVENVEKTRTARVLVPGSAEITQVMYFHRSRGDWRDPTEYGPWQANLPDVDLQWMEIDQAEIIHTGGDQIVQADCHNWSHSMTMSCAIGVQYRSGAWLW